MIHIEMHLHQHHSNNKTVVSRAIDIEYGVAVVV